MTDSLLIIMWSIIIIFASAVFFRIVLKRQKLTIDLLRLITKEMGLENPTDNELRKLITQGKKKRAVKITQELYGFTLKEAEDHVNSL
ncbi:MULTISPECIES: hypothetical protein [unclassified Paenibacillus]|uniref:hypothetical protein n=1 Tax=unclassified Paenibacillus TaxID=185978 RepID=UPI00363E4539